MASQMTALTHSHFFRVEKQSFVMIFVVMKRVGARTTTQQQQPLNVTLLEDSDDEEMEDIIDVSDSDS